MIEKRIRTKTMSVRSEKELERDFPKVIDSEELNVGSQEKEESLQQVSEGYLASDYTNKPNLSRSDRLQLDSIRAELTEQEQYYSGETDYSDDTHNWSDNGDELVSDDYWHFLGCYE